MNTIDIQDFNEWNEVGASVIYTDDYGNEHQTTTQSQAWELGDGQAVVMLEGKTGGYDLGRIRVLESNGVDGL